MDKNEHIIFQDIPGGGKNGKFHSAILTTYAIDLIHFDSHLRNVLHRKQICSINVLADKDQFDKSLEYVSPLFMPNIGKDYSITNVSSKGAFHPKINFFVGDDSVLVVLGSGNLTVTGHGKNHESFTGFMIDESDDSQRPLIEECWRYVTRFVKDGSEYEKRRILQEIPENCSFLDSDYEVIPHKFHSVDDDLQAALLYNEGDSGILSQISKLVPLKEINKVTIVSPFFDEDGETLNTFASLCKNAKIEVLIQECCSLPPYKMKENKQIRFLDFDETKRGKSVFKSNYSRLAHTKIFVFESAKAQYCIIGSANATKPGIGTLKSRGVNDEFCVIYSSTSKDFLGVLGLKTRKTCFSSPKEMVPSSNRPSKKELFVIKVLSASSQNNTIQIKLDKSVQLPDGACIYLDNGNKSFFVSDYDIHNNCIMARYDLGKHTFLCGIANSEHEIISNKVLINKIDLLESTNPSKSSRTLNRFISQIENEGYDGLEITDMLTDVMWDLVNNDDDDTSKLPSSRGGNKKENDNSLPDISYNPDYDNDDIHSNHSIKGDKASRLVECIEESIRKKLRSLDDDLKDEEELGSTETSNERVYTYDETIVVNKSFIETVVDNANKVLDEYSKLVNARINVCKKSKNGRLIKDDFNFFALSMFASTELCYLNRFRYDFCEYSGYEKSHAQKRLYDALDYCMEKKGLSAFHDFTLICREYSKNAMFDDDFIKKAHRALKYAILYFTFITRTSATKFALIETQLYADLRTLFSLFGEPDMTLLELELEPMIERYEHAFVFRYVERALKQFKIATNN